MRNNRLLIQSQKKKSQIGKGKIDMCGSIKRLTERFIKDYNDLTENRWIGDWILV